VSVGLASPAGAARPAGVLPARPLRSLVLAPFFDADAANNRPRLLAEVLGRFGPVDVVTTDFDHARKSRKPPPREPGAGRVLQLPTPAYRTNVSVARFRSHVGFAREALRFVRAHARDYDVLYATAPLNLLAAGAFAAAPGALRILDVVDVWPDVLPFPPAARRVGYPLFAAWKALFARACERADLLLAVSDRFLDEGRRWFRGPDACARRFYIGHPALPVGGTARVGGRRGLAYVGNIGQLYDFETLLDALSRPGLRDGWELHVVGLGDRDAWLRAELARRGIAHVHHGVVTDPARLGAVLARCDAGFNGYRNTSAAFSYKATTYLAAGLPLVNSMGGDLAALVGDRGLGANYGEGDIDGLVGALGQVAAADPAELRARCRGFFDEEIEAGAVAERLHAFLAAHLAAHVAAAGGAG